MQTYSVSHVLYPNRSSKKTYRAMNIDNLRKNLIAGFLKKHPDYTLYIAKVEKDGSENYLGNLVKAVQGAGNVLVISGLCKEWREFLTKWRITNNQRSFTINVRRTRT